MKIGPIEIGRKQFAEKRPASTGKEFGASGSTNYGGILTDVDYNRDWTGGYGSKVWDIIDEMRLSDGQVGKTLNFCKKPLIAATWSVEPVSDDKQDQEIADFVEWNLLEGTAKPWRYTLNHFLLALDMGVSLLEKVWEYDKETGRIYCSKLAPRMPRTVFKWNESKDNNGTLESIEQMVTTKKVEPIPADKLIHFAIDQEFDNWQGRSILRQAYKHWKMKLAYEKISVMSYERFGMGVVIFGEPESATEEDRENADKIGENLRAHESAYVRKPFGWEFDIKFGENWKSADTQIRYHNEMISAAMLQQFTDLGTMDKGSRAVGEVLEDPFYLSLEAISEQICETINKQLIPELIGYNWNGVKEYPKLKCSNIRSEDYTAISEALFKLASGTAVPYITPDFETEQHLRRLMKLPELPEEARQNMPKPQPSGAPAEGTVKAAEGGGNPLGFAEFKRLLKDFEKVVDFSGINSKIDTAADKLTSVLSKIRQEQAKQLAQDTARMAATGRIDPTKLKVGMFGKATSAVKAAMKDAHSFGKDQAKEELKKQKAADVLARRQSGQRVMADPLKKIKGPKGPITRTTPPFDEVMDNRADLIVAASSKQLEEAALRMGVPLLKEGLDKEQLISKMWDALSELSEKGLRLDCSGAITEGINEGRADFAAEMAAEYAVADRSALLDNNTCDTCGGKDGQEYSIEEAVDETLPDPDCQGGDACRCVMVYISKEEEKAIV